VDNQHKILQLDNDQYSTMEKRKRNENSTLDIIQINENILLCFGSMFGNIFRHTFKFSFVCSKFQLLLVLYYFIIGSWYRHLFLSY